MNQGLSGQVLMTAGVTAYNAEETIEEAIGSVLAQHWRPLEVVVVDDASSDQTSAILDRLAAAHPGLIRLYRNQRNRGVSFNRNLILQQARGDYIAFFDDDDESAPERLSLQYQRLCDYERDYAGGRPVLCHTGVVKHYPDGGRLYLRPIGGKEVGRPAPHGMAVVERLLMIGRPLKKDYDGHCGGCSLMASRASYQLVGEFDPDFRRAEDTDFYIRAGSVKGGHFIGVSAPLVALGAGLTDDKTLDTEYKYIRLLYKKHRGLFKDSGLYEYCLAWQEIRYAYLGGRLLSLSSIRLLMFVFLRHPLWSLRGIVKVLGRLRLHNNMKRLYRQSVGKP